MHVRPLQCSRARLLLEALTAVHTDLQVGRLDRLSISLRQAVIRHAHTQSAHGSL